MKRRIMLVSATVAVLALAGCSKDSTTTASSTTTAGSSGSVPTGSTPGGSVPGGTTPGTAVSGDCKNELEIVNAAAAKVTGLTDREVEVETAWSDQGPHPDNTVDYDQTLEVAIAEFDIPKDPQFGYGIPIGDPKAPDGKAYISFRLDATDGKIAEGQTFSADEDATDADGTVMSNVMYVGSERLLPGDLEVEITSLTDDKVCGTLSSVTKTSLQSFIGVEGTFELDRIQALEAAEEK